MSDTAFLLVILAIGVLYLIIFQRMKRRNQERQMRETKNRCPTQPDPVDSWLRGEQADDDPDIHPDCRDDKK